VCSRPETDTITCTFHASSTSICDATACATTTPVSATTTAFATAYAAAVAATSASFVETMLIHEVVTKVKDCV
jgi:hypothetical protein